MGSNADRSSRRLQGLLAFLCHLDHYYNQELDIIKSAEGLIGFGGSTFSGMHYGHMKKKGLVMPYK